jgi:hypothetical protein
VHTSFGWVVSGGGETGSYFCTKWHLRILSFLLPSPNTSKAEIEQNSHIFSVIMQPLTQKKNTKKQKSKM